MAALFGALLATLEEGLYSWHPLLDTIGALEYWGQLRSRYTVVVITFSNHWQFLKNAEKSSKFDSFTDLFESKEGESHPKG